MRGYRVLSALCLAAMLIFGILAVANAQDDSEPQLGPRLTQTASYTFTYTPGGPTETPTWTIDPNITITSTETPTPTLTATPTPTLVGELLVNGGFEEESNSEPDQASAWSVTNISKDKRICNADKAFEGECYYQFKNGILEAANLRQEIALTTELPLADELVLSGVYLATGQPKLKLKVVVSLENNQSLTSTQVLEDTTGGEYLPFSTAPLVLTGIVEQVDVLVLNRGLTGKVRLDDVHLIASGGEVTPLGLP